MSNMQSENEVPASKIVDGRVLTDRHTDRHTDTQTDRQMDRQTDRHTDRHTHRQTDMTNYMIVAHP